MYTLLKRNTALLSAHIESCLYCIFLISEVVVPLFEKGLSRKCCYLNSKLYGISVMSRMGLGKCTELGGKSERHTISTSTSITSLTVAVISIIGNRRRFGNTRRSHYNVMIEGFSTMRSLCGAFSFTSPSLIRRLVKKM
jgi:hypothetical protein